MKPNEVLLTNLPTNRSVPELADSLAIHAFLKSAVNKEVELLDVHYMESLATDVLAGKTSGILLTLGSKKDALLVKSSLRNHWFHDSLLKVKT